MKDLDIIVCVPSNGVWTAATGKSIALLFSYFSKYKVRGAETQKLSLLSAQGSVIAQNREHMTRKVITDTSATHILWIDSDMNFPMHLLHAMLEHKKEFVAANCTTRVHPVRPTAHDFNGKPVFSAGRSGIEKVMMVGLAVTLVETQVYRRMTPPFYKPNWIDEYQSYAGEDVYFTQKLDEIGVDLWVDHELSGKIGHVGMYEYGHWDVKETLGGEMENPARTLSSPGACGGAA